MSEELKIEYLKCVELLRQKNIEQVLKALERFPKLKSFIDGDNSLIHYASCYDNEIVKQLVEAGVDLDLTDTTGHTALIDYSSAGNAEMVEFLLKNGANANIANYLGETAFSFACANDRFKCAKILHQYGADINVDIGEYGGKPLDWAIQYASNEFVDWLRSIGAVSSETA